jgi:cytochrome c-type biogenesis protein CcmH
MVAKLAARLEQAPEDADGWALLGRSYMTMQRYDQAAKAYERATSLIKNNADLYADYADALAMAQGRRIDGKPLKLVEEALRVDPNHWKALAIAGSAAFERKDYKAAIGYWEKLLVRVGPETEFGRSVASNLDEARQLAGIAAPVAKKGAPVAAGNATSAATPAAMESQKEPAAGGGRLSGTVKLSPALAGKAAPEDAVFIFARAVQGSRMPLAIVRRQVKDLPYSFVLDDSQAMSPEMKLSKFTEVVVSARISKAGSAVPQSGDLQGASKAVKVGSKDVTVVIDAAVP